MAKLRWLRVLFAEWDDGSAMGISGVEPDADLEEILGRERPADPVFDVDQGADAQARNIPDWASWTETEAAAWYDEAVTAPLGEIPDIANMSAAAFQNNAQAIIAQFQGVITAQATVIRNLARMVIALRNKTWPQLEGK